VLGLRDWGNARYRLAAARDDHFVARFNLVQMLA
jgi:hypothetical protein